MTMKRMSPPHIKRMNEIWRKGFATNAEILRADFNEWPASGIDLAIEPKQNVSFLPLWRSNAETGLD